MAINSEVPGLEVTIIVDGKVLKEYPTSNDKSHSLNPEIVTHQNKCTVTNFIEVQSGQIFTIHLSVAGPFKMNCPKLEFRTFVDSKWILAPCMARIDYNKGTWSETIKGPTGEDQFSVRPMVFSKLITNSNLQWDNDKIKNQRAEVEQIGEIVVEVHRCSRGWKSEPNQDEVPINFNKVQEGDIHEKSVLRKGISHSVSFGKATEGYSGQKVAHDYIDGEDYMLATFIFKYFSKESLKILRVTPRTPSPERKPDIKPQQQEVDKINVPINRAEQEEVAKLLAKLRGTDAKKVKREFSEVKKEDVQQPAIKDEKTGDQDEEKPASKRLRPSEVVDLTRDD